MLDKANDMFGDVDFYIHLGDFVDDGKNFLQWKYVLDIPRDIMANNTFVPVAGNRDDMEVLSILPLEVFMIQDPWPTVIILFHLMMFISLFCIPQETRVCLKTDELS